jgi:hypothetical protein
MSIIPQSQLRHKALPLFIKHSFVTLGARPLGWPVTRTDGSVAVDPNTGNSLRLAEPLAGLLWLLHQQPVLIPAMCGFEEQANECGER